MGIRLQPDEVGRSPEVGLEPPDPLHAAGRRPRARPNAIVPHDVRYRGLSPIALDLGESHVFITMFHSTRPLPHRLRMRGLPLHRASRIILGVPSRMPPFSLSRLSGFELCFSALPTAAGVLCALVPVVVPLLCSPWSQGTLWPSSVVLWGCGVNALVAPLPGLPGGAPELEGHFERHGLSPSARALVLEILQGDPVRRVGGGRGNSALRYASRKMDCVIQAESRTVEGAFFQQCEFDPDVVLSRGAGEMMLPI